MVTIKTAREIEWWLFKDGSIITKVELKQKEETKWALVEEINKRLNCIMNVRNDEKIMRKLIIKLQLELKGVK